jgi:hypothetical protein
MLLGNTRLEYGILMGLHGRPGQTGLDGNSPYTLTGQLGGVENG